ncbi:BAR domain-like protein A BdpA [Rheinheimera metallidurans]|uniref:BAR domain-like protein A BdpA n=1 Tax=Rheinheimera metallidurans TaxID=2925781 RepID=UPI0030029D0F
MRNFIALLFTVWLPTVLAQASSVVFIDGFERADTDIWRQLGDCRALMGVPHSGELALRCKPGSSVLFSKDTIAEMGVLELWVKPDTTITGYRIQVLVSDLPSINALWQPVALIEQSAGDTNYTAHRVSIDDPAKRYLRLDIEAINGVINIDDIQIERILLATALQKNEQRIVSGILDKLRQDQNIELQAESFRTLGVNYAAQLDLQRQYLEYANGLHSGIALALAGSERNKMANPMAYASFRNIITDTKRVTTPLQQARLSSMLKPFGDLTTATLNVMSGGVYSAFAEPFKSFLAASFDKSSYNDADLSRSDRKFAEKNGLKIYQEAERFLAELEKELVQVGGLDAELLSIQKNIEGFRRNLDKQLRDTLQHASMARSQETVSRALSKDDVVRQKLMQEVAGNISLKANSYLAEGNSTELVRFVLKTSEQLEQTQSYKDQFNQITSAMLTYYDRFERSINSSQNPFTDANDKQAWDTHAQKARVYLQQSKESFNRAYL